MKIILVGANHAGTSFIRTLKTVNPDAQITAYDRNTNTSFLGCGIAVWVAGEFSEPSGLFYSSPDILVNKYGVNLKTSHEVIAINRDKKEVVVRDLINNKEFTDTYDTLVFAGGTWPIEPKLPGIEYNNIVLSKLYQHAQHLVELANNPKINNVVVVGAGYIGSELVEAFHIKGKKVTLIDVNNKVIGNYFDEEFTTPLHKNMMDEGIKLALGEKVVEFRSKDGKNVSSVITDKGEYDADLVIMSVGFRPRTNMIDVEKLPNGAIKVNEFQQTISDPNIYALGDSCALKHCVTGEYQHVALATNAVKTGLVAALNIAGLKVPFPGVAGTNAINIFGCHYASTGYTESAAKMHGFEDAKSVYWEDMDRPEFMSVAEKVGCKVVYDAKTLRLLGIQIGSWGNAIHTEAVFMFALAIQKGLTLPEIALTDVYFLPHFNKPFNYFLVPMLKALGIEYKA